MKKQKKPLSTGMKIVIVGILVIAVAVLGVSVYKLLGINQSYQEANNLYDDIAKLAMSGDDGDVGTQAESETSGAAEIETGVLGSAEEPVSEPAAEPVSEPAAEPVSEPVSESVSEPAAEPVSESAAEFVSEAESALAAVTEDTTAEPGVEETAAPIVTAEFSDSSTYVIGGQRRADRERLQRYADAASGKKRTTAFSGFGKASMTWNFKALHDKYPDSVGWIYQKDQMSYPIVIGRDNDQYLRHMIDGQYNVAGTLFVDYAFKNALRSRYSVIYGHNMDDRSMFGSLTDYTDEAYYNKHPYFEIYVGDYMYRYHVYAAMKVEEDSPVLRASDRMTDQEFLNLIDWVDEQKLYETKAPEITKNSVVTVLATCTEYPRNYAYRNVVVLVRDMILLKKS